MSAHLGSRVSALVDGQLTPDAAERALAHAAACPRCRDALEHERAARRAVLRAPELEPSDELTARLLAMARSAPGGSGPMGMVAPAEHSPRRHRAGTWLLASGGAAAAAVGGLFVLGGLASPTLQPEDLRAGAVLPLPAAAPSSDDDAATSDEETAEALRWLQDNGWVAPVVVPADLTVAGFTHASGEVVLELVGDDARVLLRERHGRLPTDVAPEARLSIGDAEAVLLDSSPWTAALQSGDVVVVVVGEGDAAAGMGVLAGVPAAPPESGALARVGRGWETLRTSVETAVAGAGTAP